MNKLGYGVSLDHTLRLGEIANMTAEELLAKYHMVIYSPRDIDKINFGLRIIQNVLNENSKKIEEASN